MAIAYDTSAQLLGTSGTSATQSYTAASGADVFVAVTSVGTTTFGEITGVTYNGAAMTQVSSLFVYEASFDYSALYLYRAAGAGTGSPANVVVSFPDSGALSMQIASYLGVLSIGTAVTATGTSTSPATASVTCTSGQWALAALGSASSAFAPTISAPTGGTNRQLGTGTDAAMALSDSSSTATFGATLSTSSPWSTITVVLTGSVTKPIPAAIYRVPTIRAGTY